MPATEQLNIRVTTALKDKFRARAKREGMSQADLLDALLKQRGTLPAPEPDSPAPATEQGTVTTVAPANAGEGLGSGPVTDFPTWLAGRTGIPRALTARAVRSGRVTVNGVPWTANLIPRDLLEQPIAYEGESL